MGRVGQCWELEDKAYDILGFNVKRIEVMEWESSGGFQKGAVVSVTDKDVVAGTIGSSGRPTGMGDRQSISREDPIEKSDLTW